MNKHEEKRRAEKIAAMKRGKAALDVSRAKKELEDLDLKLERIQGFHGEEAKREELESWLKEKERKEEERDQQIDNLTNIIAGLEVSTQVREQRIALRIAALRVDEEISEFGAIGLEIAWNQARALNRIAAALERG